MSLMGSLGFAVLLCLLELPVWHEDRHEHGRHQRLEVIAAAIENATLRATCGDRWPELGCEPVWPRSPEALAGLLVAKAWKESALARRWHAGECRSGECDHGLSLSLWQIRKTSWMREHPHEELARTSLIPTTYAAWYASVILSRGLKQCGTLAGAISIYATGHRCHWRGAPARVALAQTMTRRITLRLRLMRGRNPQP